MQRFETLPWDEKQGTRKVLGIIMPALSRDEKVQLLVAPGQGILIVARLRVMISRLRADASAQGKKLDRFQLNTDVNPWTNEAGRRYDSIIIRKSKSQRHVVAEILEDLLHV